MQTLHLKEEIKPFGWEEHAFRNRNEPFIQTNLASQCIQVCFENIFLHQQQKRLELDL